MPLSARLGKASCSRGWAEFGTALEGLIVSKSEGNKWLGRSPSDRKLGASQSDGSAFHPQTPCVGEVIARSDRTHAQTNLITYRSKSRGEKDIV